MTTYPAQIVFVEASAGGKWIGRLLNGAAAFDTETQRKALRIECKIIEEGPTTYTLVTHGGSINGRRYRSFNTLTEAQNAAIKWAGRRFRIEG